MLMGGALMEQLTPIYFEYHVVRFKFIVSFFFLSYLTWSQILLENRYRNDNGSDCMLSIDGTDFRMPNWGKKFTLSNLRVVLFAMKWRFGFS